MQIKKTIEKVPGGLMVVPLLLGALLNTIDQAQLGPVVALAEAIGIEPRPDGSVQFFYVGSFTTSLFKTGALTLIGLFLVCVGAQMNPMIGARALKKGFIITGTKLAVAMAVGYAIGAISGDRYSGFLGLSVMAVVAAMSNGNGGLYAALTGQYGNRSDVGAIGIISLNDGPFFTMLALGILGESFPVAAFLAVLIPMVIGFALGQLDPDMRKFLASGETLTIPFFAFALGAGMDLGNFLNAEVLAAGLFLACMTTFVGGPIMAGMLRLFGERSQIGGVAEASTAGNAVATPAAIAVAVTGVAAMEYQAIANTAAAQVSISTLTTALLCPLVVILYDRWQRARGIDATLEYPGRAAHAADRPRPGFADELEDAYDHSPTDVADTDPPPQR